MLQTIADSLKYEHPLYQQCLNPDVYRVSYYDGKFYSYLIKNKFLIPIVVLPSMITKIPYGAYRCICLECDSEFGGDKHHSICYECVQIKLSNMRILTFKFFDSFSKRTLHGLNGSYISHLGIDHIQVYTVLDNEHGVSNLGIKSDVYIVSNYEKNAHPFMATQLAPHLILIKEFDLICDIRRLISLLVIELSLA